MKYPKHVNYAASLSQTLSQVTLHTFKGGEHVRDASPFEMCHLGGEAKEVSQWRE